jgi:hypothetical protein
MFMQAALRAATRGKGHRVTEAPPHSFNDVYSGFEELWGIMAWR